MSTQTSAPYLVRRVAARAGLGVWRNRGTVIGAAIASVVIGGYAALNWTGNVPASLATAARQAPSLAGTRQAAPTLDCADTAMAAVADKSPAAARRAYQCMDAAFQQRVTEADFVTQIQSQKMPNVSKMARVGDYQAAGGGTMVYYALDGSGQSVGYIVYVGQNGKVLRIE